MTPLLYKKKKQVQIWLWHSLAKKIDRNRFTGEKIENSTFLTVIFQVPT